VTVDPVVSQGCRPVGEPMIVTEVEGPMLLGLAGRPALERLLQAGRRMSEDDRSLFEIGPQIGVVVDEGLATFGPGDFLIRNVLGADPDRGGVVIGDHVRVGTTVQFHVRDAASAGHELQRMLSVADAGAGPALGAGNAGWAQGALLFTCNGRGSRFFGEPDHDAELVAGTLGPAVAGMACAGEIGPIGGRSHLHGYTASVVILRDPA
jgi:small ligand-binding sensory domain FIST